MSEAMCPQSPATRWQLSLGICHLSLLVAADHMPTSINQTDIYMAQHPPSRRDL